METEVFNFFAYCQHYLKKKSMSLSSLHKNFKYFSYHVFNCKLYSDGYFYYFTFFLNNNYSHKTRNNQLVTLPDTLKAQAIRHTFQHTEIFKMPGRPVMIKV